MIVTQADKIAEIERIIVTLKRDGTMPRELDVLRAVAKDLRASQAGPRDMMVDTLDRMLTELDMSRTALGYDQIIMLRLAKYFVTFWPQIRAALIEQSSGYANGIKADSTVKEST